MTMILPEKLKNITLYKLDLLLKEMLVNIYLEKGLSGENEINKFSKKVLSITEKIQLNEDINNEELKFIESLYKTYKPSIKAPIFLW